VAQVEDLARLDRDRRQGGGRHLLGALDDARRDGLPVLVELVLPQQAGHDRAAQPLLSRELGVGRCALVRANGLGAMGVESGVESHGCSPDACVGHSPVCVVAPDGAEQGTSAER
jgi:hypothetical protein